VARLRAAVIAGTFAEAAREVVDAWRGDRSAAGSSG
jgi:hypothetical protein